MLNALLIQLFGREVIESLARAGFDSPEAISAAGPERLAEEGAISLSMARRIIAVAMEEPAPRSERGERSEAAERPEAPEPHPTAERHETAEPHEAAERPETPDRHVRRPFRRPHHALAAPDSQEGPAEPDQPKPNPSALDDERPRKRDEGDPFVDDVGLVSWMAAASREGSGRTSSFAVADEILDGGAPEPPIPQPVATQGPEPGTTRPPDERRPARPASATAAPAATPVSQPRTAGRPAPQTTAARGAKAVLVEGSFWSFGALRDRPARGSTVGPAIPSRPATEHAPPHGAPPTQRRRSHDGH